MTNQVHARPSSYDFVGAKFGDFVILRSLAEGRLATLYLARRASLRSFVQPIAMHVFHPHLVRDGSVLAALTEEGRVASYLEHPGISRVFDFGEANGTFYAATQYVLGETLAAVLKTTQQSSGEVRLAPQIIAHLFVQACDALHSAHVTTDACGAPLQIVHGGLSPSRLHVGYDGTVHVLDFGTAKLLGKFPDLRANTLLERLPYLAPEQIRDDEVDARADVWSLGVMLRESLSGRRAFPGKSAMEVIHNVVSGALPAWPDHVPQPLRDIAERAMQRDPRARYPSAQAMSTELGALWKGEGRSPELRMATWMQTFFAERSEEKQAMLQEAFRGKPIDLSAQTVPNDLQQSESPTVASAISEAVELDDDDESALEEPSEPSSGRSYIRLAALSREAAPDHEPAPFPAPPALPTPRALTASARAPSPAPSGPPPERAMRRPVLVFALGALLLGVAFAIALSPIGAQLTRSLAAPAQGSHGRAGATDE